MKAAKSFRDGASRLGARTWEVLCQSCTMSMQLCIGGGPQPPLCLLLHIQREIIGERSSALFWTRPRTQPQPQMRLCDEPHLKHPWTGFSCFWSKEIGDQFQFANGNLLLILQRTPSVAESTQICLLSRTYHRMRVSTHLRLRSFIAIRSG